MQQTDPGFIRRQNRVLEHASPQEILDFAMYVYGPKLAVSTAFGVEGCALIHMAVEIEPSIDVFTVDTGYLFEESLALRKAFVDRYQINLRTFEPERTVPEQDAQSGPNLFETDPEACCAMRKVEPTGRALAGLDCWIAGLRRDQGDSRRAIEIIEARQGPDGKPLVKVHPLANWTRDDVWRYVLDNDVPYNPLLDQGYKSIGCKPCTTPVGADGDERAGRWGGKRAECGIHTFLPPQRLVRKRRA